MKFKSFMSGFISFLTDSGIDYNVLRNHDGLPNYKIGTDIDFLLQKNNIDKVINYLSNHHQIVITGITRRDFITVIYIHGVDCGNTFGLELDFIHKLAFKGIDYLSVKDVLNRSISNDNGIIIPSRADEAIITFYSSYLLSGFVKEKYFHFVNTVFCEQETEIRSLITSQMGLLLGNELVDLVKQGDKSTLESQQNKFKQGFIITQLYSKPISMLYSVIKHFVSETKLIFKRASSIRVAFLGPDGAGKSTIVDKLVSRNKGVANVISVTHLKPTLFFKSRVKSRGVVTNPHDVQPRGKFTSILKLIFWAIEYRLEKLIRKRNFTLEIYDRYYHDLYIDSTRYLYSGPHIIDQYRNTSSTCIHCDCLLLITT